MNEFGYPIFILYSLIVISVIGLIFFNDYLKFVLLFFIFTTDIQSYMFTRITEIFNLFDALSILLFLSIFKTRYWKLNTPPIFWILIWTFLLGITQSLFRYQLENDLLRDIKNTIYFPMGLLIGFNWLLQSGKKAISPIFHILIISILFQSIRQIIFVDSKIINESLIFNTDFGSVRTYQFLNSGFFTFALVPLICGLTTEIKQKYLIFITAGTALIALILEQTRSFWIIIIAQSLYLLIHWFKEEGKLSKNKYFKIGILIFSVFCFFYIENSYLIKGLNLKSVLFEGRTLNERSDNGRWEAILLECNAWLDGNLLFGNGFGYYTEKYGSMDDVAWGHNGYASYLATMGLIGFFVIGVILPLKYFNISKYFESSADPSLRTFAVISILYIIFIVFQTLLSVSGIYRMSSLIPGIFLGGIAALKIKYPNTNIINA